MTEIPISRRAARRMAAEQDRLEAAANRILRDSLAQLRAAAEAARVAVCPRADKQAWQTREACQEVINHMRAAGAPRSRDLRPYECACGAWHAGDRTRYRPDAAEPRWGSAYEQDAS